MEYLGSDHNTVTTAISTFSPIGSLSSNGLRMRVLVYSTGIVWNEVIWGYANVVHTWSSFRTHTLSYHFRTANRWGCNHPCLKTKETELTSLLYCPITPCSLAILFFSSLALTRFKKSRRQLECLTCSTRMLIFLGMIRLLHNTMQKLPPFVST